MTGPKTFLELKKYNIRTIFDLERAVLGDVAPDGYVQMVGSLLYANADPEIRKLLAATPVSSASADQPPLDVASIKHGVMVMLDDLHIHRLRQLWIEISNQLGREWLYRSAPLTGLAASRPTPSANGDSRPST